MSKCGLKTEVYSRVVGYHRPVSEWHPGKQEEFKGRKVFGLPTSRASAADEASGTEVSEADCEEHKEAI